MVMSSLMNRPPYTCMLILNCFTFVCNYGIVEVNRHSAFNLGSDVNLTCSNKTWNEAFFVVWEIYLDYKYCKIAFNDIDHSEDSCNDGKTLRNTSSAQSFLHIPNFSNDDVGTYKCELAHRRGTENYIINVTITAPPSISSWLERRGNKMVAVCKAERGKPAANISWSHKGSSPSSEETLLDPDGFFTVESHLELLEGRDTESLSCVISHPFWREEKVLVPKLKNDYVPWLRITIFLVFFVLMTVLLFFPQRKLILRQCQQSDN